MRLSQRGFTLVGTMITVSIVALLAAIGIPNLLRSKMIANEASARAVLRTISTAAENFANDNQGIYPTAIADLTGAAPPYMNEDYIAGSPLQGYTFACGTLVNTGYSCTAAPVGCDRTGRSQYTITTSGVLSESGCS